MTAKVVEGDCRRLMARMDAGSVHCVVTSPPYWKMRDYGLPPLSWGGEIDCWHEWDIQSAPIQAGGTGPKSAKQVSNRGSQTTASTTAFCIHCGCWKGTLGLEPTLEMYVGHLVEVFQGVKRVLRNDGTLWLNLGDCYHNKQLQGMPWRVALALQADGWWLRSSIIWHKPNPMPESVADRSTKSHEYLFLLAKSRKYYYDAESIKKDSVYPNSNRKARSRQNHKRMPTEKVSGIRPGPSKAYPKRNKRSVWTIPTQGSPGAHFATFPEALVEPCIKAGCPVSGTVLDPFSGSGTVGAVANRLHRNSILLELSHKYAVMARWRILRAHLDV